MDTNIEVNLLKSGIAITQKCTLKCKLCGGYIPYYSNPEHFDYMNIKKTIDNYFKLVDHVGDFSITGGEPLMHPDLLKIIKSVLNYKNQINKLLILTNGTILFKDDILKILEENKEKCQITISNYGEISTEVDKIVNILSKKGITYRVINYSGEDIFCDGWVDYREHKQLHFTQEEIDQKGRACAVRSGHCNFYIMNGEMHSCGRSYRRMELGIIPRDKNEYVDLLDDSLLEIEKKKTILKIYNSISGTSCAYCGGLCKDSKRYIPAEQIK